MVVEKKSPRKKKYEIMANNCFLFVCGIASFVILFLLVFIFGYLFIHGAPHLSWEFVTGNASAHLGGGGIFPTIVGTVVMVFCMILCSFPMGVLTGIYLHEYAGDGLFTRLVRLAINNLAGMPPIIFGLFGLGFFIRFLGKEMDLLLFDGHVIFAKPSLLWASLTMALLTVPVVIVCTEESLKSIPKALKEGSYALGASKIQTIFKVSIPMAMPGILTGGILAVSRGASEVAPLLFTGVAYYLTELPSALNDQFMHLGYHIFVLSSQSPDIQKLKPVICAASLVLFAMTILLNVACFFIRDRLISGTRSVN